MDGVKVTQDETTPIRIELIHVAGMGWVDWSPYQHKVILNGLFLSYDETFLS